MRLSMMRESVATTTGAIAAGPMVALGMKKKKKKINEEEKGANTAGGYLGISKQKQPTNKMTTVWTPLKSPKGHSWEQQYAAKNNPDERLLQNFRGKGY